MNKQGICIAGNLICDIMHHVVRYPARGQLTTIIGQREKSVGGLACNTSLSLAMLDEHLPICVAGLLGDDPEGELILSHFKQHKNIDYSQIQVRTQTAYTLVLCEQESKERTFFVSTGADALFDVDDVNFDRISAKIFHAGYILLLETLDLEDKEYGTRMARLLHQAQQHGLRTSIDVVSESGERFHRLVPPALKYTDYCIINELEAQGITGVELRDAQGTLYPERMKQVLKGIRSFGVSSWAVIHCPEGSFGLDENDLYVELPSLKLPRGYIKSTTGAGDAFCAGVLYGAHEDWTLTDALRLGTASAACALAGKDSTSTIKKVREAQAFYQEMGGQ